MGGEIGTIYHTGDGGDYSNMGFTQLNLSIINGAADIYIGNGQHADDHIAILMEEYNGDITLIKGDPEDAPSAMSSFDGFESVVFTVPGDMLVLKWSGRNNSWSIVGAFNTVSGTQGGVVVNEAGD
jgi:hypothetical protein